jgi:uncharacterized protein DUF4293
MIQRIQTIWLLLAAIAASATLKLPYYTGILGAKPAQIVATDGLIITLVTAAIVFTALIAIFLFNTRKLQLRFCLLGILLEIGLLYLYYRRTSVYLSGQYTIWSIFHLLVLFFFFLASRGIRKDEKLIKESDRLR